MMRRILPLIFGMLLVAGCAPALESGTVVDKEHHPGYFTYDQCVSYKTDGTCATYGPRWHPDEYYLSVEGKNEDGETIRQWTWVGSNTYDDCSVGMKYVKGEGCSDVVS